MGKPTLVLDLDETLVSTINDPQHEGRSFYVFRREFGGEYYYIKRPGLDEFLKAMAELYTIVVYTAASFSIAEQVLSRLDPQGSCKCLTAVKKKSLKRVIWLDDSPVYPTDQEKYGIQTPPFEVCKKDGEGKFILEGENLVMDYDYENDKVLPELTPFLTALAKLDDFEAAIAAYKQGRYEVIDGQLVIEGQVVDQMVVDSDEGDDSDEFKTDDRALQKIAEEEEARRKEEERKKKEAEQEAEQEAARKLLIPDPQGPFWKVFINTLPDEEMNETQKRGAHLYISTKFLDAEADCVFIKLAFEGCLVDSVKRFGCSVNKLSPYQALHSMFNELYGPPHSPQIRAALLSVLKKAAIDYFHYGKVLILDRRSWDQQDVSVDLMETTIVFSFDQYVCFWEPIPMAATLNFLKDNNLLTVPDWFQSFDKRRWWPSYVSSDFERFWDQNLEERCRTMRQLEKLCSMDSKIVPGKVTEIYDAYEAKDQNEFGLEDFFESSVEDSRCKFYVEKTMLLLRLQFEDGTVVKCGILAVPQDQRRGVDELKKAATMCNSNTDEFFLCFDFWERSHTFHMDGVTVVVLHLDRSSVFSKEHLEVADFEVKTEAEGDALRDYMWPLRFVEYADEFDFTPDSWLESYRSRKRRFYW